MPLYPLPERVQGFCPTAVSHIHNRSCLQIQHDRKVLMMLPDRNLIYGDQLELPDIRVRKRLWRLRFWISLTNPQLTPRCLATSSMVMWRQSSRTYRSNALVYVLRSSANPTLTCLSAPHSPHSTRCTGSSTTTGFRPIGTQRKRLRKDPFFVTSRDPHWGHLILCRSCLNRNTTLPPEYSAQT